MIQGCLFAFGCAMRLVTSYDEAVKEWLRFSSVTLLKWSLLQRRAKFYAVNLKSELDSPGEYFIDK